MAIILKVYSKWHGTDMQVDITDWYKESECDSIEKFVEENDNELFNMAANEQGVEFDVCEE